MEKKSKKQTEKEKKELLKNKTSNSAPLREVIEFDDDNSELIQDVPSQKVNKK
jgi:hypothetical protein